MSPGAHTELAFEDRVEEELVAQGWSPAQSTFSAELGIDTGELYRFLGATQQKSWDRLIELYGGDQPTAQRQFAQRVAAEVDSRGVLDVLRQGVRDRGCRSISRTSGPATPWLPMRSTTTTGTC